MDSRLARAAVAILALFALGCAQEQTGWSEKLPPAGGPPKTSAHPPGFTPPASIAKSKGPNAH